MLGLGITDKVEKKIYISGLVLLFMSIILGTYFSFYWLYLLPVMAAGIFLAIVDWRSFYWLFLLSIPFSIEIFLPGGLATTVPDEPMMWFLLLASILILISQKKLVPAWFIKNPLTLLMAIHYIWLFACLILSEIFLPSLKYFIAKTWFLNAFFVLPVYFFRSKDDFKRAFRYIFIPFMILFIIIFIRHYFMKFGFRESNIVVRPFFFNHVDHSTILSMCLPMFIIAYQLSKGNKTIRIVLLLAILFLIPATLVAQARAAMLAMVFSGVVYFAFNKKIGHWIMPIFYTCVIALVIGLIYNQNYIALKPDFKHTYSQTSFSNLVKATVSGKDMSSMERLYRWIASVRMSQERPLTGVGPNNWYEFYKNHALSEFRTYVSRNPERSTTHNYFIFMLVEQGWPAMIIYGLLVLVYFIHAQRVYWRIEDPFYRKIVLGLAMTFGAAFVNNFFSELLETHKIGALFFMSISLTIIVNHLAQKKEVN
jgi:O-antigen ligase